MVEGKGVHTDGPFTFKAPVSFAKLAFALGNKEEAEMGFDQLVYEEKEFTFDISAQDLQVDGVELSDDDKALIVERVKARAALAKADFAEGKQTATPGFPVEAAL